MAKPFAASENEVTKEKKMTKKFNAQLLVLLLMILLHVLLVVSIFPLPALFSSEPINYNDYMLHYYHWNNFAEYMQGSGRSWGYNPYWMVGYPDNTIYDVENKGIELLTYAASSLGLDDVVVFKWFLMFTFILGPLLTYWAARNFGFSRWSSLVVLALQIVMWHTIPFSRVMVVTGAFSYAFVSFLSIYVLSLLYRYLQEQDTKLLVAIALLCPLSVLLHVYSAVIIAVPGLILYLLYARRQPLRVPLSFAAIAVLVLLSNLFWLIPFLRFLKYTTVTGDSLIQGSLPMFIFWSLLAMFMTPGLALMSAFSVKGYRLIRQEMGKELYLFFLITLLFFLIVGALGRYTPVTRMLVALRYHVNMFQYLAFPGALGLIFGVRSLIARYRQRKVSTIFGAAGMAFAVLIPLLMVLGLSSAPADTNPIAWFYSRKLDNTIESDPQSAKLIDWLRENTTNEGRILIESVWSPMEEEEQAWFYMHYEPILPLLVEREFVGGPRSDSLLVHHFTGFHLDFADFEQLISAEEIPMLLFKKQIDTITLDKLQEYFDLYNVLWVVCSRPVAKDYFALYPEYITPAATIGDVSIYRVNRTPSFLIGGTGQVRATYDRIDVSEWSGGDAILKYHWMEGLRTNPELQLERVTLMDDPIGFVKIHDAPRSFSVYNGY